MGTSLVMKRSIKKIYFGEYDDKGKRNAFVLLNIQDAIEEQIVSIDYTLSFYDEETLNMSSETTTRDDIVFFVLPLIRQGIDENIGKIRQLLIQKYNGQ